ncbi:hypothetical protein HY488_01050, partial [Candidatus Woesearchaeota archaeon]|nr:hypothetical protein [Candidatus Woesearchaeota archaeon]
MVDIVYTFPRAYLEQTQIQQYAAHGIVHVPLDRLTRGGLEVKLGTKEGTRLTDDKPPKYIWIRSYNVVLSSGRQSSPSSARELAGQPVDALVIAALQSFVPRTSIPRNVYDELVERDALEFHGIGLNNDNMSIAI